MPEHTKEEVDAEVVAPDPAPEAGAKAAPALAAAPVEAEVIESSHAVPPKLSIPTVGADDAEAAGVDEEERIRAKMTSLVCSFRKEPSDPSRRETCVT